MERESEIVAQSGRRGAVTIATNMAGRGTDILLGGNAEYMARVRARRVRAAPAEALSVQRCANGGQARVPQGGLKCSVERGCRLPAAKRRMNAGL